MTHADYKNELYRPQYHFTPPANWINDPNGLVYYDGEYHLFYQYHPHSLIWGPMHWGHAVSADLVHWEHLPIALYPDELGTIFSGSALIDWHNTAGFGKEAMIALYTYHLDSATHEYVQSQALAYSTDKGRSWTKFDGNPVIPAPPGKKDFRDPKVLWYANRDGTGHWAMVLAAGDSVWFYRSDDLKSWTKTGEFGKGYGGGAKGWETPDLFRLAVDDGAVDDSAETRWVLTAGFMRGSPAGGSNCQYFVGDFDGETFTSENGPEVGLWADFGADFYAAQSWSDGPDGRRIWLGWMNNWDYAREIPTPTWRGAMSLPRTLSLRTTAAGLRLAQRPVMEMTNLRGEAQSWSNAQINSSSPNLLSGVSGDCLEIVAEFQVDTETESQFGLRVRQSDNEQTIIRYDVAAQTLSFDRTAAGKSDFHADFARVHSATLAPIDNVIRLHIFVDRSSVEIFASDGLVVMTERIFPNDDGLGVALFANDGAVGVNSLVVYELGSIWKETT